MGHLAHKPLGGAPGKPRVAIEGNDISYASGRNRRTTLDRHEARVAGAPQQPVELMQLSPLALPAHPGSLGLVPDSATMEEQEALALACGSVAAVQPRHS